MLFTILVSFNLNGQSLFGLGFDVGVRSVGPKIELFTLNRVRIEIVANITRFSTFSNNFGIKISVFNIPSSHNLWLGSIYKYKYGGISTFERDGVFYKYKTNELGYFSPKIGYSYRVNSEINKKQHQFLLFELTLQYDFLFGNKLIITPDISNIETSSPLEDNIRKYFNGGIGVYASVIYFIGGKDK